MRTTHGYLTDAQYTAITGKTITGDAHQVISRAESIIDGMLGFWAPYVQEFKTVAAVGTDADQLYLPATDVARLPGSNYLQGCMVEFLTGAAAGLYGIIDAQTSTGLCSFATALATPPAAGDLVHIHQMGKVPRAASDDVERLHDGNGYIYAKTVPRALREAVAAQVAYMQELGDSFFDGAALLNESESFNGQYSYNRADGAKGSAAIIAPGARVALRGAGLINRSAQMTGY